MLEMASTTASVLIAGMVPVFATTSAPSGPHTNFTNSHAKSLFGAEVGMDREVIVASVEPVSYTHLDVYKRQVFPQTDQRLLAVNRVRRNLIPQRFPVYQRVECNSDNGVIIHNQYPVAYTHLDVYKRQAPAWSHPAP